MKKQVQIEYPDGSLHDIEVTEFNHSVDKNVDYIDYYDKNENKKMYTILKNIDGNYFKDSEVYDYTYDELSNNVTPNDMHLLPEKIENIKKNNSKFELEFEVYETDTGSYIASSIAEAFHLNKKYRNKKINNVICVPVTEDEVKRIELISNQGIPSLKARRVREDLYEHQAQAEFIVYHLTEVNRYFVNNELCNAYHVGSGTHFVNGELCREVTYEDVRQIEEKSKDKNPCLKAKFRELSFGKSTIEAYRNNETNKYYINNQICEDNNIGKGHHYINNNLFKEVTKEEIDKLKKLKIDFKDLKFKKDIQEFLVYVDDSSNRYFIEDNTANILKVGKGIHYISDKLCREVTQNEIKDVEENSKYFETIYKPKYIYLQFKEEKEIEKSNVYKDKNNNNKLFASKEDCRKYGIGNINSFRYINNIECYEISLIELTKIKKPVVKTVYLQKEVKLEKENTFIVCKYKEYFFIDKLIAENQNIEYQDEINVDKKAFVRVNENEIKEIEKNTDFKRKMATIKPTDDIDITFDNNKEEKIHKIK